ncbi:O-antigen ligase family protein [Acinetobacter vivianii]|uniref:O-antigen ligase family protein n=1 Tax=Acinetobacter vivianii TaxID=1776742 RepID=UPI0040414DD9
MAYISYLLFFFMSTSFLMVAIEPAFSTIHYGFALLSFIFLSLFFIIKNNVLHKNFFELISGYYIAIIVSTIFGFILVYVLDSSIYALKDVNMYGRIANITLFSLLSLFIVSLSYYDKKKFSPRKMVLFYAVGCFVLILTGYWQAASLYLGMGSFPFETRSMVHGVGKTDYDIEGRLTGIAAEPSYFVPFVLDFMILSLFVFKRNVVKIIFFTISTLILILSFSPSGYMSAVGSLALALLFVANIRDKKYIYFLSLILSLSALFIIFMFDKIGNIGYVLGRLENVTEDVRFLTIYEALNVFFNSNILTILFGYGLTNFKFASLHTNYSQLETSNNIFADILVELGVVGLFFVLGVFVKLFILIRKSTIPVLQRFVCYALFFDLLITGLVRADYATSRFFIIIALIFLISKSNVVGEDKNGY